MNPIFDFDGTIVNLKIDWKGLKNELKNSFYFDYDQNLTLIELKKKIFNTYGNKALQFFFDLIRKYEQPDSQILFEPIHKTVEYLVNVKSFWVVSNNLHSTVENSLRQINLLRNCKFIVGFDDLIESKPSSEPFQVIKAKFNIRASETVYIGDSKTDEIFADNSNIKFINVSDL